jgi:hypothetical protein
MIRVDHLGDFGTGEQPQYQLAGQMAILHGRFKYDFVLLVGDNLYGAAAGLPEEVRAALQAPAQCRREVLRVTGQPRRARAAVL